MKGWRKGKEHVPSKLEIAIVRKQTEKEWSQHATRAQIHALMGQSGKQLVESAGRVFFIVLGALHAIDADPEILEIRILRGAVNALHDQAENEEITELRRAAIKSGLDACMVLIDNLSQDDLIDAALLLKAKMQRRHIHMSDFQELMP